MNLTRLIFLNIFRHRIRSLIAAAGIAFGVAAMLTVLSIVLGAIGMFEKILATDSHYLVFEKNVSDLFFSSVSEDFAKAIKEMDTVAAANPILFGIVSSRDKPVITSFGVLQDDPRIRDAKWLAGSAETFGNFTDHVYLGARAAEFLKVQQGDRVPIGKDTFIVGGIMEMANGFEDGGVFMPLAMAQTFFKRDGFSSIVAVKLRDTSQGSVFKQQIESQYPDLIALENKEFSQSYSQFKILSATAWAVGVCAFLLGGMGVANTMLMAVFSRIREIAILRVVGFSKPQIAGMIMAEAAILAVLGTAGGFILGYTALNLMQEMPQLNGYIQPVAEPLILIGIVAVAFLTSAAGSIYPAWHATRIEPAEALRYE